MPKPVVIPHGVSAKEAAATATDKSKTGEKFTHKVTLENGETYSIIDSERAHPWKFEAGVPVLVPERIALKLKAKAQDNVTVKVGQKVSAMSQPKFKFEKVGGEEE